MERSRSLEQQSTSSAVDCLLGKNSELSQLNDGTATVRVWHYTQWVTARTRVGCVTFNNDGTVTVRVSHYTQCIAA